MKCILKLSLKTEKRSSTPSTTHGHLRLTIKANLRYETGVAEREKYKEGRAKGSIK